MNHEVAFAGTFGRCPVTATQARCPSHFDLSIYDEVRANAELIYERLADGTMPCYRCEVGSRSASNGAGGTMYGLLQLSDKSAGCDFDASDEEHVRDLAALIGETLDAIRDGVHRTLVAD